MILGNGALVSNEVLELLNLRLVFLLEVLDVLLRDLDITLQLQDVYEVLSFVGELLLEEVDLLGSAWIVQLVDDVEEHGVFVRLLHDFGDFVVQFLEE